MSGASFPIISMTERWRTRLIGWASLRILCRYFFLGERAQAQRGLVLGYGAYNVRQLREARRQVGDCLESGGAPIGKPGQQKTRMNALHKKGSRLSCTPGFSRVIEDCPV